jgi:hypothetical protein
VSKFTFLTALFFNAYKKYTSYFEPFTSLAEQSMKQSEVECLMVTFMNVDGEVAPVPVLNELSTTP